MIFTRAASTIRSGLRFAPAIRPVTRSTPSSSSSSAWRQVARRGYASGGGHEHAKAGSDLPWAIGGIAITVPSCYYILSSSPEEHHDSHGLHGRSHDPEERPDNNEEEESTSSDSEESSSSDEKVEEEDSSSSEEEKSEDKSEEKEESSKADESKGTQKPTEDKEYVTKTAEEGDTNETRKHIPDAKGGAKKRIESGNAIVQGELKPEDDNDEGPTDTAAASKPAGNLNHSQSGKQEGLSNTDTKHSYDIQNDPEKSKKGEGTPETSKTKGTVDVNRPQV